MIRGVLLMILELYVWVIIGRSLLSYFPMSGSSEIVRFVYNITEPALVPIRRMISNSKLGRNSMFDLSPLVLLLIIQFVLMPMVNILFRF